MNADVLIIGAGISGLMAANILQKQGITVIVLEKESGVGGRLATQHIGPGRADHGAQFFTVRSQEFRNWVSQWQYEKVIYLWATGFSHGSLYPPTQESHSRYAVRDGMNALAKHLAQDLDHVHTGIEVMTATAAGDDWLVQDHDGNIYTGKALLLTMPIPQALNILHAGATHLSVDDQEALEQIDYAPCLCGLFWIDGTLHLPDPGAIQLHESPISWIANNYQKGISPEATILTVQASPEYSRQLWVVPDDEVLEALRASLKPYIDPATKIREAQLKRWRYAMVVQSFDAPCLIAEGVPRLIFAGDAFGLGTVEGAALSGTAAGRVLYELMTESLVG